MKQAPPLRISNEIELEAWAAYVEARSRWRLNMSKADGWVLCRTTGTGHDRVPVDTALAKKLSGPLSVSPHPRKGASYNPSQFLDALRRQEARARRVVWQVGQPVHHNGRDYTVVAVKESPRGARNVLASTDGGRFYTGVHCACPPWPSEYRGVGGVDMVTEEEFDVCPDCRGLLP